MTYSYILERFWDHEAEVAELPPAPQPPTLGCPICPEEGPDAAWLGDHLRTAHPLQPPVLLIEGRPARARVDLRKRLRPASVDATNADMINVTVSGRDLGEVEPVQLGSILSGLTNDYVRIELVNERADGASARRTWELLISVPDETELGEIETCFQATVGEEPTIAALDQFADATREVGRSSYADALHGYLTALLIKDRAVRGPGREFSTYGDRMSRVLEELRHFEHRSLARAAAGVSRFNLNDFESSPWSGIPALDRCCSTLRSTFRDVPAPPRVGGDSPQGRCPIDRGTDLLLATSDALQAAGEQRAAIATLLRFASAPGTAPADAVKARVLALIHGSVDDDPELRSAAESVVNDRQFGRFAASLLDR